MGNPEWERFFALIASFLAVGDHRDLGQLEVAPIGPVDLLDLILEVDSLSQKLNVSKILKNLVVATYGIKREPRFNEFQAETYILTLYLKTTEIHIEAFKDNVDASQEYINLEKAHIDDSSIQVVLVAADSLNALRKGYPNYFQDSSEFIRCVDDIHEMAAEIIAQQGGGN